MREFSRHPATMAEIADLLEQKRGEGCEHVTFTGGEPTLFPKIWRALEKAKSLGYRTFLVSNGSALALPEFAERTLPHTDEICLSLHGHDGETHTALTGVPRSFERLSRAFANVQAHAKEHFLMFNCVVTPLNLPHLERVLRFAASFGKLRQALFSLPAPLGAARAGYRDLSPRYGELMARVPELRRGADESGVALRFGGVPVCVLGEHRETADDLYFSPRLTLSRKRLADGTIGWHEEKGLRPTRGRFYPSACGPCSLKGRCGGVYRAYWDAVGKVELTPLGIEGKACRS